MKRLLAVVLLLFPGISVCAQNGGATLTMENAVSMAIGNDPWLAGSEFRQQAFADEAVASASLPDPKLSFLAGNFPVDTFDINQEPMTQVGVGLSQMFPRGDSRELGRRQKEQLSAQEPLLRVDRTAKVIATVERLWLEAYRAQESIELIEDNRALFEYLVDAARSSYSSALGRARQQDLIRAQLELTRLEDRLTDLHLRQETAQRQLSEWVGSSAGLPLARELPDASTAVPIDTLEAQVASEQQAYELLQDHPALQAFDKRIEAMSTAVDLARQKYKPEWGVSAQYGYRADDTTGRDRADLFSLGVTVDLPVFTGNRQDREYDAAVARAEALKTEKLLMARQMVSELQAGFARLQRLGERDTLYTGELLPQMAEQADAALTAYNNDDGDFAEAVRARIAELDAKLAALSLAVDRRQAIVQINYLLAGTQSAAVTESNTDFAGTER